MAVTVNVRRDIWVSTDGRMYRRVVETRTLILEEER